MDVLIQSAVLHSIYSSPIALFSLSFGLQLNSPVLFSSLYFVLSLFLSSSFSTPAGSVRKVGRLGVELGRIGSNSVHSSTHTNTMQSRIQMNCARPYWARKREKGRERPERIVIRIARAKNEKKRCK